MSAPAAVVVLVTAPSQDAAEQLVTAIVEERLAACGNIVPGLTSIYWWDGAVQRDAEVLIIFKTEQSAASRLMARVAELHPYDVPESLVLPVTAGLTPYLAWIAANVTAEAAEGAG
jgi:periplasmic divalent cation tolerance protein